LGEGSGCGWRGSGGIGGKLPPRMMKKP